MHVNYDDLHQTIAALTEGEEDQVALMATVTGAGALQRSPKHLTG